MHDNSASSPIALAEEIRDKYREVLQLPNVEVTDDFFAIGGDSLTSLQLLGELNRQYKFELMYGDLVDYSTPIGLATFVLEASRPPAGVGARF